MYAGGDNKWMFLPSGKYQRLKSRGYDVGTQRGQADYDSLPPFIFFSGGLFRFLFLIVGV
jgi:hypothetical protein